MKQIIVKLDDIGRESHRAIFDTILWAMDQKLPISIGTIGNDLRHMPTDVVSLIKLGLKLGFVEVWNHGFRHIRYDQNDMETVIADLVSGHQAVCDLLEVAPTGFGFPFNRFTADLVSAIRNIYPDYFIYEVDFPNHKLLSPEFNSLGDGQPRFSYFMERVGAGNAVPHGIILQAHPPRWTNKGFAEFKLCVEHLIEHHKFMCLRAGDEATTAPSLIASKAPPPVHHLLTTRLNRVCEELSLSADQLNATLSNFKSYFLPRFIADAEKNYHQVSQLLYPFKPKRILDIGCGLGNWSLPFLLTDSCQSLVLNDINTTIMQALQNAIAVIDNKDKITLEPRDLLTIPDAYPHKVDFLVCANTFNYLDPVDFFRFAQSATVPGARVLLMYQTGAFNKLRYRNAIGATDFAVLAEVLSSDLAMLMRRTYCLHPTQVRHVFSVDEITKLAVMFDFNVERFFAPSGESQEGGENVYECLLFRRTSGMAATILAREEWLTECRHFVDHSFGPHAYAAAGLPEFYSSPSFSYFDQWNLPDAIPLADAATLLNIKKAITAIKQNESFDFDVPESVKPELRDFANRVLKTVGMAAK